MDRETRQQRAAPDVSHVGYRDRWCRSGCCTSTDFWQVVRLPLLLGDKLSKLIVFYTFVLVWQAADLGQSAQLYE